MEFASKYTAHQTDNKGYVQYSAEEHEVWRTLFNEQQPLVTQYACQEYLDGLQVLELPVDTIPQIPEVNERLQAQTGWVLEPVAALISAEAFFRLLADRKFPAATFIRTREELHYVKEPDVFHEIFGHCPMLTNPVFADFSQTYSQMVLDTPKEEWPLLQRLFWFTVEFGLINTPQGLRAYGGGILSSIKETEYSVVSDIPERKPLDILTALRTPYRIDMLQMVYFVIDSYQELYDFVEKGNMAELLEQAHELGELPPTFPVDDNPNVHINWC